MSDWIEQILLSKGIWKPSLSDFRLNQYIVEREAKYEVYVPIIYSIIMVSVVFFVYFYLNRKFELGNIIMGIIITGFSYVPAMFLSMFFAWITKPFYSNERVKLYIKKISEYESLYEETKYKAFAANLIF